MASPIQATPNPFLDQLHGKQSKIYVHCVHRAQTYEKCLWLCRRKGRRVVAWDIPLEDIEQGVINLKSQNRWWSRYLFYNFVGVEHVEIKFLETRRDGQAFLVIANKVNNANAITERQRSIDLISAFDGDSGCGVDIKGIRHDDKRRCDNWYEDDFVSTCRVKDYAKRKQGLENLRWMPAMLDYYWQNGLGEEGVRFLNDSGFVLAYNYLSEDCYQDAENPYGKSIDALELVSGWRIQRLLWTILVAIVSDFCIVAVATLLSDAISVGLAVGSYAVGIEALLLALLTMLSAVLP